MPITKVQLDQVVGAFKRFQEEGKRKKPKKKEGSSAESGRARSESTTR